MTKILLITPPLVQPNSPYPATTYLAGYLRRRGIDAGQFDLSVETINAVFSRRFLERMFGGYAPGSGDENMERIYALRNKYLSTIHPVMTFLRGGDPGLANLICMPDFVPQASRFEAIVDVEAAFGRLGSSDCAKYIATLYLHDISDFIRGSVAPHFEISRYGEKIAVSVPEFSILEEELAKPPNLFEETMLGLLEARITDAAPEYVGFTVPFPGNLLPALRCAQFIKNRFPDIKIIAGGGYPTTELRSMTDKGIFGYFDYVVLDDGETALERIVDDGSLVSTYDRGGFHAPDGRISHMERGCPDFEGLPHHKYFSLLETTNPMHRLWNDGRWNKMTLAHGCYWGRCAFCDTSLDYIRCYDAVEAATVVDWMEAVAAETGSLGFHFTDEAAPPRLLRDISLEMIRRGTGFCWWTNIRFENAYTGDLCRLMAAAGCIAVSGGLEVASDRLLAMIDKGVTIEQATIAMRNFYYSGIMVHSYLMYGLPTQTLQETVDSLEVVRQMFRADLIGSGFWHRYAMTVHSPSGADPAKFGVRRKATHPAPFANNEVYFAEDRGYNVNLAGDSLREALANYMAGEGVDVPAHRWFAGKAPQTTVENSLITDHLIKPDRSRIFDPAARLVWIGAPLAASDEGIVVNSPSETKEMTFGAKDARFMLHITTLCSDTGRKVTLGEAKDIYAEYSLEPFSTLYHSKKWDKMREFGLLQI